MRRFAAGLLLVFCVNAAAVAQEWSAPATESFRPDWEAARRALPMLPPDADHPDKLADLTAIAARIFPAVTRSPVPVLLPFAVADYAHDRAADQTAPIETYTAGFTPTRFFDVGPTGYDATFTLRPQDVPGLDDIAYRDPVAVQVSGFNMLYKLPQPRGARLQNPGEIEQEFPGVRRQILEHTLRYSFERYGIPYVVSIQCFDSAQRRTRLSCKNAERIATRFLHTLHLVGGNPAAESGSTPPPAARRPQAQSNGFFYHPAGKLIPGTGMRAPNGDPDATVYARMRFPVAQAPAYLSTQIFRKRDASRPPQAEGGETAYLWRDNFCERRDFMVGQCPSGLGHQGQDINGRTCHASVESAIRCRPGQDALVALRDGMVQREPWHESFFLYVNAPGERMRFRHLHMDPKDLDRDGIVSGAMLREGQPIGTISNFERRPGVTSTHLHFELHVPTRDGYLRVNPYMTLVAAYEHLIGARGGEFVPPVASDEAPQVEAAISTAAKRKSRGKARAHWQGRRNAAHSRRGYSRQIYSRKAYSQKAAPHRAANRRHAVQSRQPRTHFP